MLGKCLRELCGKTFIKIDNILIDIRSTIFKLIIKLGDDSM